MIGAEFSRVIDAVNSLRPVGTPGMLTSRTTAGVKRVPVASGAESAQITVERLLLTTESAEYLFCERVTDSGVTFYVAKPESFYAPDSDGKVAIAYPDTAGTAEFVISDETLTSRQINTTPTRVQRITPAYRDGFSVIYAMKLAEPLEFSGTTCTHVDLNIGDVRRWETLAPLDASNDVPITFS